MIFRLIDIKKGVEKYGLDHEVNERCDRARGEHVRRNGRRVRSQRPCIMSAFVDPFNVRDGMEDFTSERALSINVKSMKLAKQERGLYG